MKKRISYHSIGAKKMPVNYQICENRCCPTFDLKRRILSLIITWSWYEVQNLHVKAWPYHEHNANVIKTNFLISNKRAFISFEKKNCSFLHGLSDRSVIWEFSLGIAIEKMDAKVLFEVEAVGRDLKMIRGSIFSIKIPKENSQITRG